MKVRICETVDVEAEVEISPNEVINEWFQRMDEADQGGVRRTICQMLDSVTRLMARVSDESIAALKPEGRALMAERLKTELARYEPC